MSQTKLVSKLSMKGIGAQPPRHSIAEGEHKIIAVIYGHAHKHDVVTTTFGDSVRFHGAFKALNSSTGEYYSAGKCFLPDVVTELLVNAIDNMPESATSVEFALEIGVEYSEKGNTGYVYTVRPLVELKESEPLLALEQVVLANMKALPAPEEKAEKPAKGKK